MWLQTKYHIHDSLNEDTQNINMHIAKAIDKTWQPDIKISPLKKIRKLKHASCIVSF